MCTANKPLDLYIHCFVHGSMHAFSHALWQLSSYLGARLYVQHTKVGDVSSSSFHARTGVYSGLQYPLRWGEKAVVVLSPTFFAMLLFLHPSPVPLVHRCKRPSIACTRISSWEKMKFYKRKYGFGCFWYTNFWTFGFHDPPPPPLRRTLRAACAMTPPLRTCEGGSEKGVCRAPLGASLRALHFALACSPWQPRPQRRWTP